MKKPKPEWKKLFQQLERMNHRTLDDLFHQAHEEVFAEISCLECANCCRTTGPMLLTKDIERLAKRTKMKVADFMAKYLRKDEDGDWVFQSMPCPFLGSDNYCMLYDDRPKACREYPHTDRANMYQLLKLTKKNAEICPAVEGVLHSVEQKI